MLLVEYGRIGLLDKAIAERDSTANTSRPIFNYPDRTP